ncbi:endonuclease/exonuclease/phosphatase family protein [Gymnodinialimonas ceratoperidinii]|uniref:Endonuclease/exonuclease/phosphatase family protein n=1 Tax=Gymnodinialimonas ceratoperidinii TaxID=2856823 RepID=A0A8F6TXH8_9RHOB|nr:endonuclease/exonuclease/phosphatase family protein [Gymnodinialimonas ceratoperidinii]QXT40737.1 endonuclease/exonuclease/phosphatase family protein [Gymnodinialimonas ceratoperidinii]
MAQRPFRIATYNVEWFFKLFDDAGTLLCDDGWSGRWNVTRQAQIDALTTVFQALDADAVLIVEAPDTSRGRDGSIALRNFAAHAGIRAREVLVGFPNDTQQELMLLFDPDVLSARHDPRDAGAPRFDGEFAIDLDIDAQEDLVRFSKPPLEAALDTPVGPIRLIGTHVKSKAPHGAVTDADVMRMAIANRRKQLAQCIWLRRRVEAHLDAGEALIVAGDLNDGPGLDEYEALFGRSGLEIVLGSDGAPERRLFDPHAAQALQSKLSAAPTTSRFFKRHENRYLQALLDYVMVSPNLRARAQRWHIWHPFDDPECWSRADLREALLTASDHFPVSLDLI